MFQPLCLEIAFAPDFLCSVTIETWWISYLLRTFNVGQPKFVLLDYDVPYMA